MYYLLIPCKKVGTNAPILPARPASAVNPGPRSVLQTGASNRPVTAGPSSSRPTVTFAFQPNAKPKDPPPPPERRVARAMAAKTQAVSVGKTTLTSTTATAPSRSTNVKAFKPAPVTRTYRYSSIYAIYNSSWESRV